MKTSIFGLARLVAGILIIFLLTNCVVFEYKIAVATYELNTQVEPSNQNLITFFNKGDSFWKAFRTAIPKEWTICFLVTSIVAMSLKDMTDAIRGGRPLSWKQLRQGKVLEVQQRADHCIDGNNTVQTHLLMSFSNKPANMRFAKWFLFNSKLPETVGVGSKIVIHKSEEQFTVAHQRDGVILLLTKQIEPPSKSKFFPKFRAGIRQAFTAKIFLFGIGK
jgi:hypothetical protein